MKSRVFFANSLLGILSRLYVNHHQCPSVVTVMSISWFDSVYLNYKRGVGGSCLACKCGDVDGGGWSKDDMRFLIAPYLWENAYKLGEENVYRLGEVLFPPKNIQCLLLPHSGSSLHKLLLFSLR